MTDRKARLAALRAAKANASDNTSIQFRNYTPQSIPQSEPATTTEPLEAPSLLQQALVQARSEAPRTDIVEEAPRKVNADLKERIQPKLDRLERRTQRAIVSLLKERLEREATID